MKKLINKLSLGFSLLALGLSLLSLACLFSCASSRKMTKTESHKDTTFIDKTESKVEVTEKVDTVIYTKADTTTWSIPTSDTATVITDTPKMRIEARYNKKTKQIDIKAIDKPQAIHVQVNKKTVSEIKKDVKYQGSDDNKGKKVDKWSFSVIPWWLWIILVLLLIGWVFWKFYL